MRKRLRGFLTYIVLYKEIYKEIIRNFTKIFRMSNE